MHPNPRTARKPDVELVASTGDGDFPLPGVKLLSNNSPWQPSPLTRHPPMQSTSGPLRQYIAQSCVRELREVLAHAEEQRAGRTAASDAGAGNFNELVAQLQSRHHADEVETERLRTHVEELLRLNSTLRQSALDQLSAKEFGKIRGCMADLTREVQEMVGLKRQEHPVELAKVATDAATKALELQQREVLRTVNSAVEAQLLAVETRWKSEDERWQEMDKQVTELREQTKLIEANLTQRLEDSPDRLAERLAQRLGILMEEKLKSNKNFGGEGAQARATSKAAARGAAEEATERFLAGIEPRFDHVLQEMKRGTGVEVGCQRAMEKPMTDLEENLKGFLKEVLSAESEMRKLQNEAHEAKSNLAQCKQELEQTRTKFATEVAQTREMDAKVKELEVKVEEANSGIAEAAKLGAVHFVQQVKEIEGRGNVALDLAKGALELKKGMEFKPKKPTEAPVAQFANEAVATAALSDASELVGMLAGVRVMVESHVKPAGKGAEAFWEQLAVNRADLIREHLAVKAGENITSSIEAKGLPGKLGLNINAIVVKLDFSPGEAES